MAENDEDFNRTVYSESAVGQRLRGVPRPGSMFIVFQGSRIPITRRISVGREGNNAIELDDALVSRHHAVIQKVKDAFFIEDLFSTNGTFVNGQAVPPGKYVRLHAGDFVRIGRSVLSLRQLGIKVA